MAEETIYQVRIRGPFTANRRVRAGIVVSADDGYTGPLTKDQLKAIKEDSVLTVGKPTENTDENSTDTSEAQGQADKIVADARVEAEKIVSDARAEADKVTAEARKEAEKVVGDAKAEAEKVQTSSKPSSK